MFWVVNKAANVDHKYPFSRLEFVTVGGSQQKKCVFGRTLQLFRERTFHGTSITPNKSSKPKAHQLVI